MSSATQNDTTHPSIFSVEASGNSANRVLVLEPIDAHCRQQPILLKTSCAFVGLPVINAEPLPTTSTEVEHAMIVEKPAGWVLRARNAECRRNGLRVGVARLQPGDHLSIAGKSFRTLPAPVVDLVEPESHLRAREAELIQREADAAIKLEDAQRQSAVLEKRQLELGDQAAQTQKIAQGLREREIALNQQEQVLAALETELQKRESRTAACESRAGQSITQAEARLAESLRQLTIVERRERELADFETRLHEHQLMVEMRETALNSDASDL